MFSNFFGFSDPVCFPYFRQFIVRELNADLLKVSSYYSFVHQARFCNITRSFFPIGNSCRSLFHSLLEPVAFLICCGLLLYLVHIMPIFSSDRLYLFTSLLSAFSLLSLFLSLF